MRQLHIGPGRDRLEGFETLDIRPGSDHTADARKLPFFNQTFDLIYASHIIEHIPWYQTVATLAEWMRVLKPGGKLEVWTVDAYKVAQALIAAEEGEYNKSLPDAWRRHNPHGDPYLWCAGRMFAYSKKDDPADANWHKALFTRKYLEGCMIDAGFQYVGVLKQPRGKDHGHINLGVSATKA